MHDPNALRSMHLARFHADPAIFVAPGRVNLIGEHTDYAEGFVMPVAINFATLAAISPRTDGKIVIWAENYGEEKTFDAAAKPVAGKLYLVTSKQGIASALSEGRKASDLRIFLGYAGWGPGQLAREVRLGGWYIFDYDESLVFDEHPETLWKRLIAKTELQKAMFRYWPRR